MAERAAPRVVVVGAGFGGLWATLELAKSSADVLLVDRHNYHTFLALLYQVAAAELDAGQIAYPVRGIVRRLPNVRFAMAEVVGVDTAKQVVETDGPALPYDYLLLSPGSVPRYFGVPGAQDHAFPLKTLEQGITLRNHILSCFERAIYVSDSERRRMLMTFAIVGGGATGVEFAGALAELIRGPLVKDYRSLNLGEVRVVLLEASDRLLPGMPEPLQAYAIERLRHMGVEVRLQTPVSLVAPDSVTLQNGAVIPAETTVWSAGARGDPLGEQWGLPTVSGGRVAVMPTLQVPDHPEIYVIGDLAHFEGPGGPLPMVAPVAIQQGKAAAQNVARQASGKAPLPFHYRDPGMMATIGRNAAAVRLGQRTFTGFLAWILWLGVHLMRLVGFRNRLLVLINWAWDYFLFERAVRLILPSVVTGRSANRS